jgi:hypothetical protein
VTVGGYQAVAHQKSCARNPRANHRTLVRETHLVDAINVADGVAIAVQHDGGHGLVLLELLDLCPQFVNLLLEIARGLGQRGPGREIMDHGEGSQEQDDSQNGLHGLLPAIANYAGFLRVLGFGNRGLVDLGFGHGRRSVLGIVPSHSVSAF